MVVLPTPPEPQQMTISLDADELVERRLIDRSPPRWAPGPGSAAIPSSSASASSSSSASPRSAWKRYGSRSWGSGSRSASRPSCSAWSSVRWRRKAAAAASCVGLAGAERRAGGRRRPRPGRCRARTVGVQAVHHDRPEAHADAVLEVERGLDELVDRGLLRQRDEHDLAAVRRGEQLEHVGGLRVDRPDLHRVGEAAGRLEERDRVAGGRRVEDDEVGGAVGASRPLELLDLAEHEDVADAGHGGGDHVERAGGHQPLREPPEAVLAEVLEERVVGGERAGPDRPRAPRRRGQLHLVVGERIHVEHRRQPALALDLDDEGGQAGPGRGAGEHGRHRRFADAALARHDDDTGSREESGVVHVPGSLRRRGSRRHAGAQAMWSVPVRRVPPRRARAPPGGMRPGRIVPGDRIGRLGGPGSAHPGRSARGHGGQGQRPARPGAGRLRRAVDRPGRGPERGVARALDEQRGHGRPRRAGGRAGRAGPHRRRARSASGSASRGPGPRRAPAS